MQTRSLTREQPGSRVTMPKGSPSNRLPVSRSMLGVAPAGMEPHGLPMEDAAAAGSGPEHGLGGARAGFSAVNSSMWADMQT